MHSQTPKPSIFGSRTSKRTRSNVPFLKFCQRPPRHLQQASFHSLHAGDRFPGFPGYPAHLLRSKFSSNKPPPGQCITGLWIYHEDRTFLTKARYSRRKIWQKIKNLVHKTHEVKYLRFIQRSLNHTARSRRSCRCCTDKYNQSQGSFFSIQSSFNIYLV